MAYPVTVTVEPLITHRNRLTTAFRLILAIPHLILVGGLALGFASRGSTTTSFGSETGILGAIAWALAIISWFTIVLTGTHISGIRQFTMFFLRWRVRAVAYFMLLEDQYPPFGDMPYPASVEVVDPATRDRLTVGLRILLLIPHFIVFFFVLMAWCLTTVIAWFLIVLTGSYPAGLYAFGVGALRWYMRIEAYLLLLVDEYPPFSLD
jgi:Domain of unknown function (DUF4389)